MRHHESLLFWAFEFSLRLHRIKGKRNLMNQQKAEKIKMRWSVFYITFKIRVLEEEIIQKVTCDIIYM